MSVVTVRFPILTQHYAANYDIVKRAPGSLAWAMVEEHAPQCVKNHDQSVARLAERGGLDPWEAVAVLTDRPCYELEKISAHDIVTALWELHDAWVRKYTPISEQLLMEFKTKWSLAEQRAFIEKLWLNHAYFHGIEGQSVMTPLESGDLAKRVSAAWADGKAIRDKERTP
jgi:hypothetical protein